jgi:transporter family protein
MWAILALVSAMLISIRDIIAKQSFVKLKLHHKYLFIQEYSLYVVGMLFFIPFMDFTSVATYWYLLLFKTVAVAFTSYFYLKLLREHDVTTVAPLTNLSPIVLLLIASVFLGESLSWIHIVGILITVGATYYLEVVLHHHKHKKTHKAHFSVLKDKQTKFFVQVIVLLILFSLTATADKLVLQHINVPTSLLFTSIAIFIACMIRYSPKLTWKAISLFKTHPKLFLLSFVNLISTGLVLLAIAVPGSLVSLIIPLRRTATLYTSVFGGLLFHEKHLLKKVLAVVVMITGVFLIVIG